MKRKSTFILAILFIALMISQASFAQLTGTKSIPGDYASISAAITDLNTLGVGTGGVTFNIAAGYTETASNLVITATGTASNPIIFQKSGSGSNPLITAGAGTGTTDGIIKLSGSDYVTFDGISLLDPTTNTTTTTQMEWGFALLKVDGTNGSQNNTIKNCSITLQKINTSSNGIYSANHTTASTTTLTVTSRAGANSNNKFYNNSIQNCYSGIWMGGYADATAPYDFYDNGNDIGSLGGNTIRWFGGSSTTTYGIYTIYQDSLLVNNNNIGGGSASTSTHYGIMISTGTNSSITVYNNTVSDTTASTTSSTYGIALSNAGVTGTNNTVIVKRNTVQGMTSTATTSGSLYGYYVYYTVSMNLYVDSNQFINNKWGGATQTATGTIYGFYVYPYTTAPNAGSYEYITNNYIAGNKRTQSTVGSGTLYGMYLYYGQQNVTAYNNIIENDTLSTTTGASYYMYVYNYYSTTVNYYNNAIRNIYRTNGATGTVNGFYISNAAYSGTFNFYNNTANNFKCAGNATGAIYGIYNVSSAITKNMYGNTAYSLAPNGSGSVYGIYNSGGTTVNIYKNSVYDLRTSTGYAYGLTTASGTTVNMYNNYVSDLRVDSLSTTLALMGLYVSGGTTVNAYYNTVYLNSVSLLAGQAFGTAAFYASTTPTLDFRNNNIVNASTPGTGGGYTVAYYRSSATTSTYSALSNCNNFYAGTPDTNHIIYYDGTNYKRTLLDYKLFISPTEAGSVTENPPFINVSTRPYNLHINAAIATQLETTGSIVSTPISITDDFDGNPRYPNSGYPVNPSYPPTAPDIGADEFGGIPLDVTGPFISYTALPHTPTPGARTLTATISDGAGVPTTGSGLPVLYWKVNSGTYTAVTGTSLGSNQYSFTFGGSAVSGDNVYYYICAQDLKTPPNVSCYPATGASGFTYNPPAVSTPPSNASYYTLTSGLSGDYTVGLLLFNKVTGKNISFERVVRKVKREVNIEEPIVKRQIRKNEKQEESETTASLYPNGRKEMREVEEVVWIPVENGKEYKGNLYIKRDENPNYSYPMGVNGIYASLTAAIADLNARSVTGPTRFLLNDASYSTETLPLTIAINNTLLPTATNTITIKPNTGVISTISGLASGTQIFKIKNNYVTIDGSNTVGGTTRDLTLQNTSTTTPQVVLIGSTGTTPITNVTVKNCNITNGANTSTALVISDGTASGSAGYFNNITIQNNSFKTAYMGIYSIANILTGNGSGLLITGNDMNTTASPVRLCKVYVQGVDGATISNNNIGNDSNGTDASNITGIWLATGTVNATISGNNITNILGTSGAPRGIAVSSAYANANVNITGNTITGIRTTYSSAPYGIYVFSTTSGVSVKKNKIGNMLNTNTGGYGARALNIATSTSPANIDIVNNFIWNIVATNDASVTYWSIGIALDATISNVNVYFNSVNLYGTYTGYTSATNTAAFYCGSGITLLNLRNNIFKNSYNNLNTTTDKSYAIYTAGTSAGFTDINYNDYYATDSAGTLGYLSAAITTLPAWQTATGKDLNSVSGNPYFLTESDLHIDFTQTTPVKDAGQYISSVTDDIDGGARYNPPDIGGDEGTTLPAPLAPALALPTNNATGVSITPAMDWSDVIGAATYRIQISTDSLFGTTAYDSAGVTVSGLTVPSGKLVNFTKYYWRVNSTNTAGTSGWSTVWNFTTIMPVPSAPVLQLPLNNALNVSLTPLMDWDSIANASSYRLQINTDSTFTAPAAYDTTGYTLTQITVPSGKLSQTTKYYWRVNATNAGGTGSWSVIRNFTTMSLGLPLNLKVYLEGFWNGTTQVADTVGVYLALGTSPFTLVDSAKLVLGTAGTTNQTFTRVSTGNYYIVIKHRNHLETWSANPVTLTAGTPVTYDFTTSATQAYGSNMKQVGSVWVLFGGDPNMDGSIDAFDVPIFLGQFGMLGYLNADFNGDESVDASDVPIFLANFGLLKATPGGLYVEPKPEVIKKKKEELQKLFNKENKKSSNNQ